jgi:hypothetical protein
MADHISKDTPTMTTPRQEKTITLSYVRRPAEEAEVLAGAADRLGRPPQPPGGLTTRYLLIGIVGGAGISLFLHAYRSLILLPFLGLTPLVEVSDLLAICSVPCLAVYLLLTLQLRREARQRIAATAARIRPDISVTVTISPQDIAWEREGASVRLAWNDIGDIAQRHGRIEFDSDASVAYIPGHAFHNQQEQAAMLVRIEALWKPKTPAKS